MSIRRVVELLSVLLFHVFGAFTWLIAVALAEPTDREYHTAIGIGGMPRLIAALLIVWRWHYRKRIWWIPIACWWSIALGLMAGFS